MAGIALALWNLTVAPGKRYRYSPQNDIRVTGAALGDELTDSSGRSTLKVYSLEPSLSDEEDDEEEDEPPKTKKGSKNTANKDSCLVICSLTPGKIEQHLMDLVLLEGQVIDFHVVGKNAIYLSGNYVHQDVNQDPDDDDSDDEIDEDEVAFPLDEWGSDVEGSADDLEEALGRIEEVPSDTEIPPTKSLKRPRDSDAMEEEDDDKAGGKADKLSKSERKKLKKLKNENGEAVPVGSEDRKVEKATSQAEKKKDKKKDDKATSEKKSFGEKKELPGGLIIQDAKVGTGPTAKKGNLLSMRYIGKLTSGKVFDSNTSGKPFKFKLGAGEVIKGWDQGIAGMQVGGERVITVPPLLAYGKRAQSGIPANSTLVFEVKLLEVK